MTIFGEDYAGMYDQLYADKNYERECEFVLAHLENRFHQPLRLLDLGCGTGGHAQYLANQGHKVTGIDISQSMLDLAVEKISPSENQPEYFCSDSLSESSIHFLLLMSRVRVRATFFPFNGN